MFFRDACLCVLDSEANIQQALSETDLELGSTDTLANGGKSEPGAARRLASRLYHLDGFRGGDVARHLGKNNEFSRQVAEEYLQFFDFTGMSVDKALRSFLRAFALMGETQERERVLAHFSHRFYQCNPGAIASEDGVHTLTCALMLLNTDLHGHVNIGKRMSCQDFIGNLESLNDGKDFPRDLLKALYSSIKNDKLEWTINEEELRRSLSELVDGGGGSSGRTANRLGNSSSNPFLDLVPNPTAEVHKVGFLTRKVHADADGRKTPKGRRGWKTFLAVLRGMVLYLHKREYKEGKELTDEELRNAISIHHSLANPATDYAKRPDVLRLVTADWRVFLFQAQNQDEMDSWIFRINLVAAIFSAPPFPAAVSSQKRFTRPLLPSIPTKLSLEQQMQSHEAKLVAVRSDIDECKSSAAAKQSRGRENDEHRVRENYLLLEKTRYEAYVNLLTAKRRYGSDTEISHLEALVRGRTADGALRKSHSSPSVNQATSPPRSRVRRNMSERRAAKHSAKK
uniref:PH and SEC7 domain-containing protein 1-like isoform X1 n=2 Tax=Myxine glutinosa TaxID=7769 RepID=UPI00358EF54A